MVDMAIIRGKLTDEPHFIKNGGEIRCQMTVGVELTKQTPAGTETLYTSVLATTEPALSEKCKAFLEKNDDVMIMGEFGFHKGRLKMRVKDISLPDVQVIA